MNDYLGVRKMHAEYVMPWVSKNVWCQVHFQSENASKNKSSMFAHANYWIIRPSRDPAYDCGHGRRKDFFQEGATRGFSKYFPRGSKVVKFVFSHSKLRKQPLFAKKFKIQGVPTPPFRRPWLLASQIIKICVSFVKKVSFKILGKPEPL